MAIKNVYKSSVYQTGTTGYPIFVVTDDSLSTIKSAGWLNQAVNSGLSVNANDFVFVSYPGINQAQFTPSIDSNGIITLMASDISDIVILPVTAGNFAFFANINGQIEDLGIMPSNSSHTVVPTLSGSQINYLAIFTSDGSLDKVAPGGTGITPGNLQAGLSGTPGSVGSFPPTPARGSFLLKANDNSGDFIVALRNAPFGQSSTLNFPDPGTSSANVLLDTGTNNILTDFQQFLGLEDIIGQTAGTWTTVRNTTGDWSRNKQAAADTSITGFDLVPALRAAASKGFELRSIDVIYAIATLALNAHTATLTSASYINNTGITLTNVPLTGSLATAVQTNLYVSNLSVTTPVFFNAAVSKYVFELTVNAQSTSAYALYGINLHFYKTIA